MYERDEVNPQALTDKLGESWCIPDYSFKPWPGCRCNHATIGLGIALNGKGVTAGEIKRVEIGLGSLNWLTVGGPYDVHRASVTHAQFNAAYSFARALSDGRVDLRSYQENARNDPAIIRLTSRISVVNDPAIDAASQAARVTITLNDGRVMEETRVTMKGSPLDPMSEHEIMAKFRGCLEFGTGASSAQAERLADAAMQIDQAADAAAAIVEAFPDA